MNEIPPRLTWTDFVRDLSSLLRDQETGVPVYIVGGAVRDAYLGRAITDIDIAVDGHAEALARRVADWLHADIYVLDRERDVARVLVNSEGDRIRVDFARFRRATLEDDLRDRDFTINAMASELTRNLDKLIDPLGGASDLHKRQLRRCSANAIKNDPIRALRAVRLSTQFGLKIHPDTAADVRAHAGALTQCSGERIRDEFFKLLGLDRAARGLRVLLHLGILNPILPLAMRAQGSKKPVHSGDDGWDKPLATADRMVAILSAISSRRTDNTAAAFDLGMLTIQLDRFRATLQAHVGREYGGARSHAELLVLAALLTRRADIDVAALKLSATEERSLRRVISNAELICTGEPWTMLDQHRFWRRLNEGGIDVILLAAADFLAAHGSDLRQQEWLELVEILTDLLDVYFNRYHEIVDPPLLLNGHDIQEQLKVRQGPLVGELLTNLREAQVAGKVRSRAEARAFVEAKMVARTT